MAGTPWHLETLRMSEDDERRHKSRCINYKKPTKTCKVLKRTCPGSAHCEYYKEDPTRIKTVDDTEISSGNYRKPETGSEQNNSVSVAKTDTTVIYDGTILYPLGSHVRHKIHGSGIVSKVEKDYVTVVFDEGISKEFSVDYCTKNSMLVREITDEEIRIAQEKDFVLSITSPTHVPATVSLATAVVNFCSHNGSLLFGRECSVQEAFV